MRNYGLTLGLKTNGQLVTGILLAAENDQEALVQSRTKAALNGALIMGLHEKVSDSEIRRVQCN